MLLLVSNLIGRPVITMDEAEQLGMLRDPIIDPANGKLAGYFFGHGMFNIQQSVISANEVASYDQARVVVHHADVNRKVEEEPKIREILSQKIPVYGAKVTTESGKYLGRANDLLLDTELNMIIKYYVHGLVNDRIVPAERVISIDKRGIIVDDVAKATGAVPAEAEVPQ